jgi:hypothetical protein
MTFDASEPWMPYSEPAMPAASCTQIGVPVALSVDVARTVLPVLAFNVADSAPDFTGASCTSTLHVPLAAIACVVQVSFAVLNDARSVPVKVDGPMVGPVTSPTFVTTNVLLPPVLLRATAVGNA